MTNVAISRFARGAALAIAFCWASSCGPARAANLVTNGGFETGDFTGWTTNPSPGSPFLQVPTSGFNGDGFTINAYEGTHFAYLGYNTGITGIGTISQSIPTIPGDFYKVSYAYIAENGTPNGFTANFGPTQLFTVTDDTSQGANNPVVWSFQTYIAQATSSSTLLSFASYNNPFGDQLDGVSVTFFSPEPSSIALLSLAGVGLVFAARRRNRKVAAATV